MQKSSYNLFRNLTEFTDENGHTETYIHQDNGLTSKQIHPDRTRQEFTWGDPETPEEFLMQSSTDEVGAIENFTYYGSSDFSHRELYQSTEKHFPGDSIPLITEFDYSRPASKQHIINVKSITVDPGAGNENIVTSFAYDNGGRLETTTDALGNVTERDYYQTSDFRDGLLKSETSPRGTEHDGEIAWEILDDSFTVDGDTLSVRVDFDGSVDNGLFVIADAIRIDSVGAFQFTKIIDDDNDGLAGAFQTSGTVEYITPNNASEFYGGDRTIFNRDNGGAGTTATWTFAGIPAGEYRVSASWFAVESTRRDDVHYYLADGTVFGGTSSAIEKSQKIAPDDLTTRFETVFDYDAAGNVISATTDGLASTANTYDHHGNLVEARDPTGVKNSFQFDVLGRLEESQLIPNSNSLNLPTLTSHSNYDSHGRLESTIDPLGRQTVYEYDSKGNLLKQTLADDTFITFEYDNLENSNLLSQTDQLGRTTRFRYDSRSRLIETIHPDGASERVRYNGLGQVASTLDAIGNETKFSYDAAGRLLKTTNAEGKFAENFFNDLGRLSYTDDFNNQRTGFFYDSLNRVTEAIGLASNIFDPNVSRTTVDYDAAGNVVRTAVYDMPGLEEAGIPIPADIRDLMDSQLSFVQVTETRYDNRNRPVETTNADGTSFSTVYDQAGRVIYAYDELHREASRNYDNYGRLWFTLAPAPNDGNDLTRPAEVFDYDAAGNLTQVVVGSFSQVIGPLAQRNTTEFEYDVFNRVVTTTDAEGGKSRVQFDIAGQVVAGIDALGRAAYTQYDERGRAKLTRASDPDGNGPLLAPETRFKYDAAGNLIEQIDPQGFRTTFEYDEQNRLVKEKIVSYSEVTDSSSSEFDPYKGSVTTVTNDAAFGGDYQQATADEGTNSDQAGVNWIFTDLPTGTYRLAVSWVADPTHSTAVSVRTLHGGQNVSVGAVDQTISPQGFVRSDGEGTQEWQVIDEAFPIAEADSHTLRIRFLKNGGGIFSADAVLVERISSRTFTYDDNGNLETETDTLGRVTNYTYDALNRIKTVTLPDPNATDANNIPLPRPKTTTSYDGFGNVTKTIEDRGGQNRETHWTYDSRNRVLSETLDATGSEVVVTEFQYNDAGNLVQTTDALGTSISTVTTFDYDDLNRLVTESVTVGDAVLSTESVYDALSYLIKSTDITSRPGLTHSSVTEFTYDHLGRQTSLTRDPLGSLESTTTFEYDAIGNLRYTTDPLGRVSENKYDRLNRLIETVAPDPDSGLPGLQSPVTTVTVHG